MSHDHFRADYAAARSAFLDAASDAGADIDHHHNDRASGPRGGELWTDAAWIGPEDAPAVVACFSGTHGVEGFYGSGCQVGWLREARARALPAGVAMLLVHAINPYGFAWQRRVTEGNVDLNRNFIDHASPPSNPAYAELHPLLVPERWDDDTPRLIGEGVATWVEAHGRTAFRRAVVGGQHTHADGLFYGGTAPEWSNETVGRIAAARLATARRIAVVDFHTGLGPFGFAELICRHPGGSDGLERARRWYGDAVTAAQAGESESPPIEGNLRMALPRLCASAEVTAIGVEVGTRPSDDVMLSLVADNWLHLRGDPESDQGVAIKRVVRDAFFPDEESWTAPVYARSMEILEQAAAGVAA